MRIQQGLRSNFSRSHIFCDYSNNTAETSMRWFNILPMNNSLVNSAEVAVLDIKLHETTEAQWDKAM